MEENYPLYPSLQEEAKKEAQQLIDSFKSKMFKVCEETLSSLYTDVATYIETDSWTNFRNEIIDGMKNYSNRKIQAAYDFKEIRQAILKEHRDEIIFDLNNDMILEIESLKKELERERKFNRSIY